MIRAETGHNVRLWRFPYASSHLRKYPKVSTSNTHNPQGLITPPKSLIFLDH
jgi:hypothetical protein